MFYFHKYSERRNILKFIKLGKPQFAIGLFFYFSMGALLAGLFNADLVFSKFMFGLAIIFLSTWSIHYHNDYFDYEADQHVTPTPISGGSGVLVEHPEWRNKAILMAIILTGSAIALSVIFTIIFSYPSTFILYVIVANLLGWVYAAPPLKLSYRGLGEFGNTAIGFLFPGLGYFAMIGTINLPFVLFSIPILFLQLLFTISVEIPDMDADRLSGKMTWIAYKGREFGFKMIAIAAILSTISFLFLSLTHVFPTTINFYILALISLIPLSLAIYELIKKPSDKLSATKYCIYNLASIFGAVILINCYFIFLIK